VIDHCGLPREIGEFDQVLALAKYRNVFLKWCHAPRVFRAAEYPFPEVMPHLARALDAFGRERIMWASDFTAIRTGHTWAEALFYLRDNPSLSEGDKEWILGRTLRTVLDWPAPAQLAKPVLHRH
jgi:predicted TIM-barrel fold metal-dependent hydrolase